MALSFLLNLETMGFAKMVMEKQTKPDHIVTILPTAIDQSHRVRETMVCYFEVLMVSLSNLQLEVIRAA